MQSSPAEESFKVKEEQDLSSAAVSPVHRDSSTGDPVVLSSDEENAVHDTEDVDKQSQHDTSKQLVLYDPIENDSHEIEPLPDTIGHQTSITTGYSSTKLPPRVLPSVGAFTVQCANCFKWRLIPSKEKYEEIREHILENPFVCETAREWRPDISCDDPADLNQDRSRLWAIDKPNIAQPPPGWERELRIRGEGSSKFADVYYITPSGKRLRSMIEVQKYLIEHPEYVREGVKMSQFSFQTPKPLQEDYVRKRPARLAASYDDSKFLMSRPLEPAEVRPLSWASPDDSTVLRLGGPGLSASYYKESHVKSDGNPAKKARKSSSSSKTMHNGDKLRFHLKVLSMIDRRMRRGALTPHRIYILYSPLHVFDTL
ncbi:methyl-CpG-binding domain-containing protein, variant 2 [Dionaea muscipula]